MIRKRPYIVGLCWLTTACQPPQKSLATSPQVQLPAMEDFNGDWQFVRDVDTTNAGSRLAAASTTYRCNPESNKPGIAAGGLKGGLH